MSDMILHKTVTGPLGPIEAQMMEYLWAGNGLFVRAKRKGLEAIVPIVYCPTQGLAEVIPYVKMDYPRLPVEMVDEMFGISMGERNAEDGPLEIMFRVWWNEAAGEWRLETPEQERSMAFCRPLSEEPPNTIIEIHSHHAMDAWFSPQDNLDERGFRLYGVMGEFDKEPVIRMRLGIFGHYMDVRPADILKLPNGLSEWVDDDTWEVESARREIIQEEG